MPFGLNIIGNTSDYTPDQLDFISMTMNRKLKKLESFKLINFYCPNCNKSQPRSCTDGSAIKSCSSCGQQLRYQCSRCPDKVYSVLASAQRHVHGECVNPIKLSCFLCDYQTARKYRLITHIRNKHSHENQGQPMKKKRIKKTTFKRWKLGRKCNRGETKRTLAQNDSQKKSSHQPKASTDDEPVNVIPEVHYIKEEVVYESDDSNGFNKNPETLEIDVQNIQDKTLKNILMGQPSVMEGEEVTEIEEVFVEEFEYRGPSSPSDEMLNVYCELCGRTSKKPLDYDADCELRCQDCENLLQFQCMKCNRLYRMHDSALSHVRYSCPSATTLYCSQCEFRTNRKRNLQIHIKNAHSDPSTENQHQCKQCQKKYKRRKHLQRHEKSCGKLPHIPCRFCSYKCKRNDHLLQHMQHRHPKRGVKPVSPMAYSCSKCDKKYKYQTSLRDHEPYCKGRVKQEPVDEPDKKKSKRKDDN
ncbi:hypothetical protein TSAR_003222 [Trichomalopsis sarcophagae]|uniref:C2H2-type domain-containing protein n=1 Tax=Trichomalopsis sarcophagae TaxID=543379 RepID=A0A232EYT7_9HYME|nr:hypothetical protein TSAR_003222 [Trichomalopsis sarcophagae]